MTLPNWLKMDIQFKNTQKLIFKTMNVKALFFDIDGTLVSFKTHVIPQSAVDALRKAKRHGSKIFISTGRPMPFIINLKQIEDLIDGYITTNGALCIVNGRTICRHALLPEDVDTILATCRALNAPCLVVGCEHITVLCHSQIVDEVLLVGLGLEGFKFATLNRVLQEPILQLTPFINAEQEAELMGKLKACTSGRWTESFTDITHINADKGKGLKALADHLGINIKDTIAFGDGGNDIPILRQAGVGVAMGNAAENVKQNADYVTTHVDEDGIKKAMEKIWH